MFEKLLTPIAQPIANRIEKLPYSFETKMKIAEISGFTIGFVGTGALIVGGYVAVKKLTSKN